MKKYIQIPPIEEWPDWANGYVSFFTKEEKYNCNFSSEDYHEYVSRPVRRWKPKEGEEFWFVKNGVNHLMIWNNMDSKFLSDQFIAAVKDLKELRWSKEQFRERGDYWDGVE